MNNNSSATRLPDPTEATQLIESDELVRYVVKQLGGRIIAITDKRPNHPRASAEPPAFRSPLTSDAIPG
ncbi:MAG: hypothetical protein JXB07_04390 [Anaerolineae bacterium]|nr:hypothetical protein [Anaerolineae bacterium]